MQDDFTPVAKAPETSWVWTLVAAFDFTSSKEERERRAAEWERRRAEVSAREREQKLREAQVPLVRRLRSLFGGRRLEI